jgi:shikimate kinase
MIHYCKCAQVYKRSRLRANIYERQTHVYMGANSTTSRFSDCVPTESQVRLLNEIDGGAHVLIVYDDKCLDGRTASCAMADAIRIRRREQRGEMATAVHLVALGENVESCIESHFSWRERGENCVIFVGCTVPAQLSPHCLALQCKPMIFTIERACGGISLSKRIYKLAGCLRGSVAINEAANQWLTLWRPMCSIAHTACTPTSCNTSVQLLNGEYRHSLRDGMLEGSERGNKSFVAEATAWLQRTLPDHGSCTGSCARPWSLDTERIRPWADQPGVCQSSGAHGEVAHGEGAHGEGAHGEGAHGEGARGEGAVYWKHMEAYPCSIVRACDAKSKMLSALRIIDKDIKCFPWIERFSKVGHCSVFEVKTAPGILIVSMSALRDTDLVFMGTVNDPETQMGFPRGFFAVVDTRRTDDTTHDDWNILTLSGFLPKFGNHTTAQNDDSDMSVDDKLLTSLKLQGNLTITPKFSGSLGGTIMWKHDESYYYASVSKNSADYDTKFVKNSKRLLGDLFHEHLTTLMNEGIYSIWGEVMAFNDQVHGARVLQERAIVTYMGRNMTTMKKHVAGMEILKVMKELGEDSTALCKDNAIPFATITDDQPLVQRILTQLSDARSYTTNTTGNQILEDNNLGLSNNMLHNDVSGDCLEGWVISNPRGETVKLKSSLYTIRTMFLRPFLQRLDFTTLPIQVEHFVARWVTKDARDKYRRYCIDLVELYYSYEFRDFKNKMQNEANHIVADHIEVADRTRIFFMTNHTDQAATNDTEQAATNDTKDSTRVRIRNLGDFNCRTRQGRRIICVIGPAATGKSSISEKIGKLLGVPHVDCDKLIPGAGSLNEKYTATLELEKEPVSAFAIASALSTHSQVVVSTGGGLLRNELFNNINGLLGNDVLLSLAVVAPSTSEDFDQGQNFKRCNEFGDRTQKLFKDEKATSKRLGTRIEASATHEHSAWYQMDGGTVAKIARSGPTNWKFIQSQANRIGDENNMRFIYRFDQYNPPTFGVQDDPQNSDLEPISNTFDVNNINQYVFGAVYANLPLLHYNQLRTLMCVRTPKVGPAGLSGRHVTIEFSREVKSKQFDAVAGAGGRHLIRHDAEPSSWTYNQNGNAFEVVVYPPSATVQSRHITIKVAGGIIPSDMIIVARAILKDEARATLEGESSTSSNSYPFAASTEMISLAKCEINMAGITPISNPSIEMYHNFAICHNNFAIY